MRYGTLSRFTQTFQTQHDAWIEEKRQIEEAKTLGFWETRARNGLRDSTGDRPHAVHHVRRTGMPAAASSSLICAIVQSPVCTMPATIAASA